MSGMRDEFGNLLLEVWSRIALTLRQRIHDYMVLFEAEYGHPPTMGEIAKAIGHASTSKISNELRIMRKMRIVTYDETKTLRKYGTKKAS